MNIYIYIFIYTYTICLPLWPKRRFFGNNLVLDVTNRKLMLSGNPLQKTGFSTIVLFAAEVPLDPNSHLGCFTNMRLAIHMLKIHSCPVWACNILWIEDIETYWIFWSWHGSRLVTQPHMTWDIYVGLGQILHPKCYNHIFILSFLRVTQTCHLWSPHPMPLFRCMSDWVSQDLSRSTCKAWCLNGETNLDRAHGS